MGAGSGRALLLCARDPTGELTGRKVVLETIASCLDMLGYDVTVAALTRTPVPATWLGRPLHHITIPPIHRVAFAGLGVVVGRGTPASGSRFPQTLNEALFDSASVRDQVRQLAAVTTPEVVVADTLRAFEPALATGVPVVTHLDDLLSERYAAQLAAAGQVDVLGYFAEQLPRVARRPAAALASRLLAGEARRLRDREVDVVRRSAASATTSPVEAALLSRRAGHQVASLPMAVDPSAAAWNAKDALPHSAVFLGSPSYAPNRSALRWWRDHLRPALDAAGGRQITLTVVGSDRVGAEEFEDARLRFTGYVEDLAGELRRHTVFVAPITEGGGIKTKVLDAMASGLPVVATSLAVAGIPVRPGLDAWVHDDAQEFASAIARACGQAAAPGDPRTPEQVGAGGRAIVGRYFATGVIVERWRTLLSELPL